MRFANADVGDFPPKEYQVAPYDFTEKDLEQLINLIYDNANETEVDLLLRKRLALLSFTSGFFSTGHHRRWIIPQAKIKPSGFANGVGLIPDYLFAGNNSDGVTWWLIELKSPKDKLYQNKNGRIEESDKLRSAISQISEYIDFCEKHQGYIRDVLGLKSFISPYGVIIMGREHELKKDSEKQLYKSRYNKRTQTIQIRTFDAFIKQVEWYSGAAHRLPFLTKIYRKFFIINELTHHDRYFIDDDNNNP